jgi:hypothetical protein
MNNNRIPFQAIKYRRAGKTDGGSVSRKRINSILRGKNRLWNLNLSCSEKARHNTKNSEK